MPTPKLPHLYTAPSDRNTGIGCAVHLETTGPNKLTDQIKSIAVTRFGFQRNTGKFLGIIEQYAGDQQPPLGIDFRGVDFILLRSEVIIAHDTALQRGFLTRKCPTAEQRPWRCARNGVDWAFAGVTGESLSELFAAFRISVEELPYGYETVHGLLLLLTKTDQRGRSLLFQMVGG